MPTYWSLHKDTFLQYAKNVNPRFEKILQSSLHPLMEKLKKEPTPQTPAWTLDVKKWLLFAKKQSDGKYRNKANKYKDALYHLVQYLGIASEFSVGGVDATRACRFQRTNVHPRFDPSESPPDQRNITRIIAPCAWQSRTIEDSVARGLIDGIVVIHMGKFDGLAMNMVFDGWKTIDHMNSVLRVAGRMVPPIPLALIEIDNKDVCDELGEASNYPNRQRCSVSLHNPGGSHSGQHNQNFRIWINGKQNVVVMGYDGSICVRANLFGVPETIASALGVGPILMLGQPPAPKRWVRPLVTVTSVETSRALLACSGKLMPGNHVGEYGLLYNK
ncbi:MAG: hypothetical protein ABIK28_01950 [Planctomycetota bacterium]